MSIINVSDICQFVNESSFEEIKEKSEVIGLCIKEKLIDDKQVFLLANINDNFKNQKNQKKQKNTEVVVESGVVESEVVESGVVESDVVELQPSTPFIEVDFIEPSAPVMSDIDNEKIMSYKRQANGLIFESDTNRVICMCQNRLQDIYNFSEVIDLVKVNSNGVRIEYCEDGTILRLYNYGGVWRTATTRCITASSSYWASDKDFDTMFWETFDKNLLNTMDTNFTYVFVLLHRENRIVVKHNVNMLVYISRINNSTFFEDFSNQFRNVYGIKRPKLMDVDDFRVLGSDVNNFDCKFKRGIVIKIFDKTDKTWNLYKYDFERYKMIKSIRGNVPQIRMRYLELLNKPESLVLLEQFYTENAFMFTYIKASVLKLVKTVYRLYVDSHIKHTIKVTEENLYYRTLRQLHAQYKITNKPIGFTDVQQKIYSLDKMVIKKLLGWE